MFADLDTVTAASTGCCLRCFVYLKVGRDIAGGKVLRYVTFLDIHTLTLLHVQKGGTYVCNTPVFFFFSLLAVFFSLFCLLAWLLLA